MAITIQPDVEEVRVNNSEKTSPEIIIRVSETTASLVRHFLAAKGKTVREILQRMVEEDQSLSLERLIPDWLRLFRDCLKADAIFLRKRPRQSVTL